MPPLQRHDGVWCRGASPAETFCIDDETRDIEAARAVGADAGAVQWGYPTPEALARFSSTLTFAAPAEIPRKIARAAA